MQRRRQISRPFAILTLHQPFPLSFSAISNRKKSPRGKVGQAILLGYVPVHTGTISGQDERRGRPDLAGAHHAGEHTRAAPAHRGR
jgi:hypothetical protein